MLEQGESVRGQAVTAVFKEAESGALLQLSN